MARPPVPNEFSANTLTRAADVNENFEYHDGQLAITLQWQGNYAADANYYANDIVRYNGVDYRAVTDTIGTTPGTDDTKWMLFAGDSIEHPGTTTDNAIVRWNGTNGQSVQDSAVQITDAGALIVPEITAPSTPASGYAAFYLKSDHKPYIKDSSGVETQIGAGTGDVVGPSSATDNALAVFDTTTGKLLKNSTILYTDAGAEQFPDISEPGATTRKLYSVSGVLKWAGKFLARWSGTPSNLQVVVTDSSGLLATEARGTAFNTSFGTDNGQVRRGDDGAYTDARTPTAHANFHKHGGSDEVATTTAAANAIPKAGAGGTLDQTWLPQADTTNRGTTINAADGSQTSGRTVLATDKRLNIDLQTAVASLANGDLFTMFNAAAGAVRSITWANLLVAIQSAGIGGAFNVTQTAHGFTGFYPIRFNGTNWVKAQADTLDNAEVIGLGVTVDANTIRIYTPGSYVTGLSGFSPGQGYFLDQSSAGAYTTTAPTTGVNKPVFFALSSSTAVVLGYRAINLGVGSVPTIVTAVGTATVSNTTDIHHINAAGATAQTLPAAPVNGEVFLKNIGAGTATISANTGQTIASGEPTSISTGAAYNFYLDGTVWRVK